MKPRAALLPLAVLLLAAAALQDPAEVDVTVRPLAGAVHWLEGAGGNIGISAGPDGVLVVDSQFEWLAEKNAAALADVRAGAPRFLINTHWHGDHTGGNAILANGAVILAHENVRRRLVGDAAIGGRVKTDTTPAAVPVVTYAESGVSLHFNGEEVRLLHFPNAHTDGDTVVWFTGSNVVHMGDLFFDVGYPFVDTASGGDVEGVIAAVEALLALLPADIKVVPGHGAATDVEGLRTYLTMLTTLVERVRTKLAEGASVEELVYEGVTADHDARWGKFRFVTPEKFVRMIVTCLTD